MHMKKIAIRAALAASCLAVAFLAGCATGPDFKAYGSTLNPPKEGESRIWFYRPSKLMGSVVQPAVNVNGIPVGKAQPGCYFYADRPPGTYEIKCTTEWSDTAHLTVLENQAYYVRLTLLPGVFVGHLLPKVVPEQQGLREIEGCRLITADGMNKNWSPPETAKPAEPAPGVQPNPTEGAH